MRRVPDSVSDIFLSRLIGVDRGLPPPVVSSPQDARERGAGALAQAKANTQMRMILPGVRERRSIDRQLTDFFREHREVEFRLAIRSLSRFYHLRAPRVDWYEYLDWGRTAGRVRSTRWGPSSGTSNQVAFARIST